MLGATVLYSKLRNFNIKAYTLIVLGSLLSTSAQATFLDIYESSVFFNSTTLGNGSLLHEGESVSSGGVNDLSFVGIDVLYSDTLNTNNLGEITWSFTNNTGFDLENAWLGGFLDLEVGHTFFDEYGELVDVSGAGAEDNAPDSWEIDEPGYVFGDIYDNLSDGYLDNFNNVDDSYPDDVSLGLGFDLGTINSGSTWSVTFEISNTNIGGLSIIDPDSASTYFWNGSSIVNNPIQETVSVPEPGSVFLAVLGLFSTFISRRRKISI